MENTLTTGSKLYFFLGMVKNDIEQPFYFFWICECERRVADKGLRTATPAARFGYPFDWVLEHCQAEQEIYKF